MRTSRSTNESTKRYYRNTLTTLKARELRGDTEARRKYNEQLEAFKADLERRGEIWGAKEMKRFESRILRNAKMEVDPYTTEGLTKGQKPAASLIDRLYPE